MKKIKVYISLLLLGMFSFGGMYFVTATKNQERPIVIKKKQSLNYTAVPMDVFISLMEEKEGILLDVRSEGELKSGKLEGAMNIDVTASDFESQLSKLDKKKVIFVYSAIDDRAKNALLKMKYLGFIEVYNLQNGIREWKLNGGKVIK
jgi:rhodanese-related sulfurtransferase